MKRVSINTSFVALFFVAAALIIIVWQLNNYDISDEQIESVIRHYATSCYALEGSYPSSLAYLQKNYGLILDEKQYAYFYDAFASNILPDIKVMRKTESEEEHE